jgi:hypothetical protein
MASLVVVGAACGGLAVILYRSTTHYGRSRLPAVSLSAAPVCLDEEPRSDSLLPNSTASLTDQPADVLHAIAAVVADPTCPHHLCHLSRTCVAFNTMFEATLAALRRKRWVAKPQIRWNGQLRHGDAYLDRDSFFNKNSYCMTTMSTPHQVVRAAKGDALENQVYFIAQLPLENYVVHCWSSHNTDWYGGSECCFLIEDGSFETVKWPSFMECGWRDYTKLVKFLQLPQLYRTVCKISVGTRNAGPYFELVDIVYEEPEMSLGPILPRIRPEWHNLQLKVFQAGRMRMCSVANLVKRGEDDFFDIKRG